jgi:GLPGLI family protein
MGNFRFSQSGFFVSISLSVYFSFGQLFQSKILNLAAYLTVMKKFVIVTFLFSTVFFAVKGQMVKTIADCTITYTVVEDTSGSKDLRNLIKTSYIRGKQVRTDVTTPLFHQSLIYDNRTGSAVILREMGDNKFLSMFDAAKWRLQNKKYEDSKVSFMNETKIILGYECKKAVLKLKDGNSFELYYTSNLKPSASENPFAYGDIPGFILEYETSLESNGKKIKYLATDINFSPVPTYKFEIPKEGYKIL